MTKKYNLYIGNGREEKGFLKTPDFPSFKMLLDTIHISQLSVVTFDKEVDNEEYAIHIFKPEDFAVELITRAKGNPLPQCMTIGENKQVSDLINHYSNMYKHDNYCAKIEKK